MTPYARTIDRLEILYRLPFSPVHGRLLQVVRAGQQALSLTAPEGCDIWTIGDCLTPPPAAPSSCARAVLHDVLDTMDLDGSLDTILQRVHDALAPQGVVMGCFRNPWNLRGWLRSGNVAEPRIAGHTIRDVRRSLHHVGFVQAHFFHLLPDSHEPLRLVDADPDVARQLLTYEVAARKGPLLPHLARMATLRFGIYPTLLTMSRFFWAFKPC
jgi:hypothetical protein